MSHPAGPQVHPPAADTPAVLQRAPPSPCSAGSLPPPHADVCTSNGLMALSRRRGAAAGVNTSLSLISPQIVFRAILLEERDTSLPLLSPRHLLHREGRGQRSEVRGQRSEVKGRGRLQNSITSLLRDASEVDGSDVLRPKSLSDKILKDVNS